MEQLTEEVAKDIAAKPEEWMRFLDTASRLYKYTFDEQLLIFAQRPEATAVASMEVWNKRMYRWIRKGSKGIALIDYTSSPKNRLRYVFDISDTYKVRNLGKDPALWVLPQDDRFFAADYLQRAYGLDEGDGGLAGTLHQAAQESVQEWLPDAFDELKQDVQGTFLEELDEQNQEVEFRNLMTDSVWYVLLKRCGMDTEAYLSAESLRHITDFNDLRVLGHLGTAVNEICRPILMQLGRYVLMDLENDRKTVAKESEVAYNEFNTLIRESEENTRETKIEENKEETEHERDHLQQERGLSDPGYQTGGDQGNHREIRDDAEGISEEPQESQIQHTGTAEQAGQPSDGSGQRSQTESGRPDHAASGERPGTGEISRQHGMDPSHEPDPGTGRRTGGSGDYIQLSLFPTEEEQFGEIRKAAAALTQPAAFFVSDEIVDDVLRTGSGRKNTLFHITAKLVEGIDHEELRSFLIQEYGTGGKGFEFSGQKFSVWYDGDGMRFRRGESARHNYDRMLTWEEAANRIQDMYDAGTYVSNVIMKNSIKVECDELSSQLALHFRDTGAIRGIYSHTETTERFRAGLDDPEQTREYYQMLVELERDMERHPENYMRYQIRNNPIYKQRVYDLGRTLDWSRQEDTVTPPEIAFITQDEIDSVLRRGGNVAGGRNRIYEFFMEHHDEKEAADFLKHEYGDGGCTPGIQGSDLSDEWHDAKGIRLSKGQIANPSLTTLVKWKQAASRTRQLIRMDDFLSPEELEKYEERQEAQRLADMEEVKQSLETEEVPEKTEEVHEVVHTEENVEDKPEESGQPLRAEDVQNLVLVNRQYSSVSRTTEYDFTCEIRGEQDILHYTVEYHDDGEGFTIHTEKDDIWERMSEPELERLERVLEREALYFQYHEDIENAANLEELREIQYSIMENESIYFRQISERVWNEYGQRERELSVEIPAVNFHITDDQLGYGTAKEKFRANVMAIQVLKKCERENRYASSEEQEILSNYVGWGGLPDAFDESKASWSEEYQELKDLLTKEEYAAARESTLNAHYTRPVIIESMYQVLQNLGFEKGNILEPSMGVGNFFGMLPDKLQQSRLYGVELDSISGRIAKLLYPNADIQIKGFEKTDYPNDFFDVAIGNVPFGSYKVNDRQYDKYHFMIHDYFLAKTIDQLRPGGVAALITTKGTMDKASSEVRKYLAERAELLGAVRLPNNAFKANAGTEVSADILFFQKRESISMEEPEWVALGEDKNGITINQYFITHPEMVLGTMAEVSGPYGMETACLPLEGADLAEQLEDAAAKIHGTMVPAVTAETELDEIMESIPADPSVRNYSFTVVDDQIYYRVNSLMNPVKLPAATAERVKGMVEIREVVRDLIALQMEENATDEAIRELQVKLNQVYDVYTGKYGVIGSNANKRAFSDDSSYCLLCSLEDLNEDGTLKRKADMFTKRTIKKAVAVTSVETAAEALTISLNEKARVDLPYMAGLTGKPEEKVAEELPGVIFRDPVNGQWETADEYLSGNVREKLKTAKIFAENHPEFTSNVHALKQVQPVDLDASEIEVRIGATWIAPEIYRDFMEELFDTPGYLVGRVIDIRYSEASGAWNISGKNADSDRNVLTTAMYGTSRINAYKILEETLNLKDVRIYDTKIDAEGNEIRVLNKKETMLATQKQDAIKEAFKDWIFRDQERREKLCRIYAAMTGDDYEIRKMVRDLADAVRSSDEDKVDEILWNAREKIDSIPDRSVGMAELKGYGYTADDMFPLRQEMALELHRVGEKVYCLQSDGSHGDYASREMILEHEGLYGIEKDAWQRMQEQEDEIDFEEAGLYQPLMTDLDRDEALRMFDAGETVFLVTTYQRPIAVRERMEIERGPEHYQMEREDVERIRTLEKRMQEYPQITSLKEAQLLLGTENRYGIYQIIDGSPGREYEFMDLNFIERHGYQVKKEDYELIYSDKMLYGDTLDSLYEKFNIAHPADYTGHSLSVSDIVVLNENGNVKAYFVDSISFRELPDFLQLEPEMNQEEVAYRIGDQYFAIQMATEGYDYSFYDKEYKLMDGGILDDPDISMRQAIQNILEDEGLEQLERIPVDYDELQEKEEEVEAEILHEARSQRKRVPVISDHTEAEAGLNGMSRSEIEETVWAIAQAEIMENDLDARIQAVRVYGSRTRNGLYKEDSDVDVVIAYEGTVREDDLFSALNEAGYKVGNMRVDMNPIRPDKTGTLEDFLEKSERYLDEKTEQMKAGGEYKPLAKVEELEEANYNMIDNVLNNMPPKKEPYLEYYAAECDEYHNLGNIYKSTNLDEILAKYREIIDDPTLSYYGNGMGIVYRDPNDTFYDEAEVSLISRKSIRGDNLDDVAFLAALPMVHEALEKIVEVFPDFRYYPPKELNVHYYPEKMNADELAAALDQLAEDFDPYDYHDNFSPEEDMVETVALELRCGCAHRYIPFLKDIIDEECEESPRAEELLEKLKAYQPEIPETAVPVVRINFCEDKEMDISGYQKLGSLDEITAKMDAELASQADPRTGMPEKTVQMYFTIYYPDRDQMQELKGKINIGDGNGGIVSQLKNQNEMKLHDESWLNYQKAKGEESFQAYMADLTDMQEHVLPYLQGFCNLEERAPERSVEPTTVSKSEMETGKTIASVGNEKSKTVETARKSIHERLKINKEIIARQQGKDSKEKGVELA